MPGKRPAGEEELSAACLGTSRGLKANIVLRFLRLKIENLYSLLLDAVIGRRAGGKCAEEVKSYVGPLKMGNDQA